MEEILFELFARDLMMGLLFGRGRIHSDPSKRRFAELKTNRERVDFMQNLIDQGRQSPLLTFDEDRKDNILADELRETGNYMYGQKDLTRAHFYYNKSLMHAEAGSPEMALAYGNRSAVLFERKHYEQCLQDISRAFECGYPANLYEKLLKRKRKAMALQKKQKKTDYHDPPPNFEPSEKNECIISAANTIKMVRNSNGCKVIATRDIKMGELIAIEKPFISMLSDSNLVHCFGCFEICFNMIPCPQCTVALYCTENCRTASWNKYHKFECGILKTLCEEAMEDDILPLRMTVCARDLFHKTDKLGNKRFTIYHSNRYLEVYQMKSIETQIDKDELWNFTQSAVCITNLLAETTDLFTTSKVKDIKSVFSALLLHNMLICKNNSNAVSKITGDLGYKELGTGIYPFISCFRYSCDSNVHTVFYGQTAAVRVRQNIAKEEELFIEHGLSYYMIPKSQRQRMIKEKLYYTCKCKACENSWPLFMLLRTYDQNIVDECKRIEKIIKRIGISDVQETKAILEQIIAKASKHCFKKPSYDWFCTGSLLEICHMILGNRDIKL